MAKLTGDEKKMLDIVLGVAGDNENMIRAGLIKALQGQNDKARRKYLWNILNRSAEGRIKLARKKASTQLANAGF